MSAPTFRKFTQLNVRRNGFLRWAWEVTDGIGGPLLNDGVRRTRGGAQRAAVFASTRCEPWKPSGKPIKPFAWSDEQVATILARFADDLHKADTVGFEELACQAECWCRTDLGERMRALVDAERASRREAAGFTVADGGDSR